MNQHACGVVLCLVMGSAVAHQDAYNNHYSWESNCATAPPGSTLYFHSSASSFYLNEVPDFLECTQPIHITSAGDLVRHGTVGSWYGQNSNCAQVYEFRETKYRYEITDLESGSWGNWRLHWLQSTLANEDEGLWFARNTGFTDLYPHCKPPSFYVEAPSDDQSAGRSCSSVGNPVHPATGNKFQRESDYAGTGDFPLVWTRYYNSQQSLQSRQDFGVPGRGWRFGVSRALELHENPPKTWSAMPAPRSSIYPSRAQACASGWDEIRDAAMGHANLTAVWEDEECRLYEAGKIRRTISVHLEPAVESVPPHFMGITAIRDDGRVLRFRRSGAEYVGDQGIAARLEVIEGGYKLVLDDIVEIYDADGRLASITDRTGVTQDIGRNEWGQVETVSDSFGRTLRVNYDEQHRPATLTDPGGGVTTYAFREDGLLEEVIYADDKKRTYRYEDPNFAMALTGIIDENGERFASWTYDDSGRVKTSSHAGGADRVSLSYDAAGVTTVTDALGASRSYSFDDLDGRFVEASLTAPCPSCGAMSAETTYDSNGFVATRTDFNGNLTIYERNERGLEERRTEAVGTPEQRVVETDWHPDLRLPLQVREPGRSTTYTYDANGNRKTQEVTDAVTGEVRITAWTYNALGQVRTVDGPRTDVSDVTAHDYDAQGNRIRISNALGHVIEIPNHDAHGNPLRIIDANGVETLLTYDLRQRLRTRTIAGATTVFDYDGVGQLIQVTQPDGSSVKYGYDAAHRLERIEDGLGNRIVYTLDGLGNREKEEVFDPLGVLRRTQAQVFDTLGRLREIHGANGQLTELGYDDQGNETTRAESGVQAALNVYDALHRLRQVTDAAEGVTTFDYDALDRLASVEDPTGLTTTYAHNAFADLLTLTSPDTGTTTYTYDLAGNRRTQTDARGVTVIFSYDALNRLTFADYPGTEEDIRYHYDGTNYLGPIVHGVGRLSGIEDASGTLTLTYDERGNLVEEHRVMGGDAFVTGYAWDAADRLAALTYPSGRVVTYDRDSQGRIRQVKAALGGDTDLIAEAFTWLPFGPATGWTYGNGIRQTRDYDLDYRITALTAGAVLDLTYGYDGRDRITGITDALTAGRSQVLGYDDLSRLKDAQGAYGSLAWTYDGIGNRKTQTLTPPGGTASTDTYSYPATSHRLQSAGATTFAYDPAGAVTQRDGLTLTYNAAHRLSGVSDDTNPAVTYRHDAMGRRTHKSTVVAGTELTRRFIYSAAGELLAELDEDNTSLDHVLLDGQPLAVLASGLADGTSGGEFILLSRLASCLVTNEPGPPGGLPGEQVREIIERLFARSSTVPGPREVIGPLPDVPGLPEWVEECTGSDTGESPYGFPSGWVMAWRTYYVHPDHLGTPRVITDEAGTAIWRWDASDPFGTTAPIEDPDGDGIAFTYNLRFPGQYYDAESGLHQNWHRDYESGIGRYVQSDPVGLNGGINTYGYAIQNPISLADPTGLAPWFGNYCGPGSNSGPPSSCLDDACRRHDDCYEKCGLRAGTRWVPPALWSGCAVKCDNQLIRDAWTCRKNMQCYGDGN